MLRGHERRVPEDMVPVRLGSGNPGQVTPTFLRVKRARCHFYPAAFGGRFISQQPDWKPHIRSLAFHSLRRRKILLGLCHLGP